MQFQNNFRRRTVNNQIHDRINQQKSTGQNSLKTVRIKENERTNQAKHLLKEEQEKHNTGRLLSAKE